MCHYFAKVGKKNRRGFYFVFSLCQVSDPHSRPVGGDNESLNFFAKCKQTQKMKEKAWKPSNHFWQLPISQQLVSLV